MMRTTTVKLVNEILKLPGRVLKVPWIAPASQCHA